MIQDVIAMWPYVLGVCGLFLALGAATLIVGGREYRFQSGRVNGVVGDLGGGKSMFVVTRVLRPVARGLVSRRGLRCSHTGRPVRQIITNFTFDPTAFGLEGVPVVQLAPAPGITIWEQIIAQGVLVPDPDTGDLELRIDALIAVDEMSMVCPSDASKFDELARVAFVHMRKWNCEFWWMAQDTMQVHKRARKFSQRIWWCEQVRGVLASILPGRRFGASAYKPNKDGDIDRVKPPVERMVYLARKRNFSAYRSFETIASSTEDLAAVTAAMQRAGLVAGESRRNDLAGLAAGLSSITGPGARVRQNANGPHPQISTPESATRFRSDAERSASPN